MKNNRFGVHNIYDYITSSENIFAAWREFQRGKNKKSDVLDFYQNFEQYLIKLTDDLRSEDYQHGKYESFYVCDPKQSHIHKAAVKDRVLHHAVHRILYPIFDQSFIFDSYSSRKNKGTHKAILRFLYFARKLSQNNTKTVWVLKCDIKKFFDSVDHCILIEIINKKIIDKKTMSLIEKIILSFHGEWGKNKGIPLGNLTSQLFANIYLDKADQFIKRELRVKYYIRYCDDFVILSCNRRYLNRLIFKIKEFLEIKLNIRLHPKKIFIKRWHQGVDFLGFVIFPHHIVLRTKTKKRILKNIRKRKMELMCGKISEEIFKQILQSYLSIFLYCRSWSIRQEIIKVYRK